LRSNASVIFWQLGGVFQAFWHIRAVEIGAQANVFRADQLHRVIDVIDDRSHET